jgi:uncharacterized protein YndB with AHSA1/START domain
MEQGTLKTEQVINAPVERVWKAITDAAEMKKWYFDIARFEARPGFEFKFVAGDEKKQYTHYCRVTAVVPQKKLAYTWKYDEYPVVTEVTFEIEPLPGDKTRVILNHDGLDSFPQDNPSFRRESFAGGWKHIIGTSLKEYLEK